MSCIDVERPQGVSSRITSAAAWSDLARSIESFTKLAETGLISLFSLIARTSGRSAAAPEAAEGTLAKPARTSSMIQSRVRIVGLREILPAEFAGFCSPADNAVWAWAVEQH